MIDKNFRRIDDMFITVADLIQKNVDTLDMIPREQDQIIYSH